MNDLQGPKPKLRYIPAKRLASHMLVATAPAREAAGMRVGVVRLFRGKKVMRYPLERRARTDAIDPV